jgi:two-component system, LytTR family, sensor kinase
MFRLNRPFTILFHAGVWSVMLLCIWVWHPTQAPRQTFFAPLTIWQLCLSALPVIAFFYLNAYWLIPVYLTKKTRIYYIGLATIGWLVAVLMAQLISSIGSDLSLGSRMINLRRSFPGVLLLMASLSLGISRENAKQEKARKEKENEHLRTELSFLRTQVNPHFMLNVLNSMVLLARKKSDLLEPVLLELARLMNYMLYDVNNEKISLEDEIGYLRAYIDLQMLRFGSDVTVRFNVPATINGSCIEPMLLIPLVENAFKHGIGLVKDPLILIDVFMDGREWLTLTVKNKYSPLIRQEGNRPSGIGLSNLKKRLELIYPGRYELQRTDNLRVEGLPDTRAHTPDTEHWFVITLNIPLQ